MIHGARQSASRSQDSTLGWALGDTLFPSLPFLGMWLGKWPPGRVDKPVWFLRRGQDGQWNGLFPFFPFTLAAHRAPLLAHPLLIQETQTQAFLKLWAVDRLAR